MGTWRYTCSPTLGRNHTNVPYATNYLDEKVTWKDTCSPTVERNHTIVLPRRDPSSADSAIGHSIKVDLSENISSCTLELSHTSVKYATNHLSVMHHLIYHSRIHSGEGPFNCGKCGKSFNQRVHLKTHQLTHTGAKPFKCEVCEKSISQSGNLKRHMHSEHCSPTLMISRTNTKSARNHLCKLDMWRRTCSLAQARSHTNVVTATNPIQTWNLKAHVAIHSGERPHRCDKCNKSYAIANSLRSHLLTYQKQTLEK